MAAKENYNNEVVDDNLNDKILLLGKVNKSHFLKSGIRSKSLNNDHLYDPLKDYVIQKSIMTRQTSVPSDMVAIDSIEIPTPIVEHDEKP